MVQINVNRTWLLSMLYALTLLLIIYATFLPIAWLVVPILCGVMLVRETIVGYGYWKQGVHLLKYAFIRFVLWIVLGIWAFLQRPADPVIFSVRGMMPQLEPVLPMLWVVIIAMATLLQVPMGGDLELNHGTPEAR